MESWMQGLECPLCKRVFEDARRLRCNHTYCLRCLIRLVRHRLCVQGEIQCPNCLQVYPLPCGGVGELPPDKTVAQLQEKLQDCRSRTKSRGQRFREYETCQSCPRDGPSRASNFCPTCRLTMCQLCTTVHEVLSSTKHHDVADITGVLDDTSIIDWPAAECESQLDSSSDEAVAGSPPSADTDDDGYEGSNSKGSTDESVRQSIRLWRLFSDAVDDSPQVMGCCTLL